MGRKLKYEQPPIESGMKICSKCGPPAQPIESFYRDKYTKDGYHRLCKKCHLGTNQKYHREYKWKQRGIDIKFDQYEIMLKNQNYVCEVCKKPCNTGKQLAVDHNHETGQVRGLLCVNCNHILSKVNESIEILQSMIDYLRKYDDGN